MATHRLNHNERQNTTTSLPNPHAQGLPVEEWPLAAMTAAVNSPSPAPNVLALEYDPYAYGSPAHGSYGHAYTDHLPGHGLDSPLSSHHRSGGVARHEQYGPPRAPTHIQDRILSRHRTPGYPDYGSVESPQPPAPSDHDEAPAQFRGTTQQHAYANEHPLTAGAWMRTQTQQDAETLPVGTNAKGADAQQARQGKGLLPRKNPRRLTTREEANFQCEIKGCGKLFNRSYNYKAHMETHDDHREYPFSCAVEACDKKFVRKTDLQRHHQSVHTKERNYGCDYCGRLFSRKDTLRRYVTNAEMLARRWRI